MNKQLVSIVFFCLFLLEISPGYGQVEELIVWNAGENHPRFIMPRVANEEPELTFRRYLSGMNNNSNYPDVSVEGRPIGVVESLKAKDELTEGLLSVLVANRSGHMSLDDRFFRVVFSEFTNAGGDLNVLPLGLDSILSPTELTQFRELISNQVPMLVILGGADIDPSLYGEANTFSRNTNLHRDQMELGLLRRYIDDEQGTVMGFCRGHRWRASIS